MNHAAERQQGGVNDLLAASDPVRSLDLDAGSLDSTLDEIGAAIVSSPRTEAAYAHRRPRPFARRRLLVALVAAGVVVLSASGIAAAALTARTGQFQPTPEQIASASPAQAEEMQSNLDMGGPGELLNPGASDFAAVALQVAADIPYPKDYDSWRDFLIARETYVGPDDVRVSEGALRGWFAGSAFIAWVHSWRQALVAGDEATAQQAAEAISRAPGWSAVTDIDPQPDPSAPGDAGPVGTLFGWMLPYRDAVSAGDLSRVEHLLATGYGEYSYTADPKWDAELAAHHPEWSTLSQDELAQRYLELLQAGRLAPDAIR